MSDSVRPHRQQPTRLPHPWDSPGKNTGVGCHFLLQCMKVKSESGVAQSCLTLHNPMDCSLQASLPMGFSRQEYWSGVPSPSPRQTLTDIKGEIDSNTIIVGDFNTHSHRSSKHKINKETQVLIDSLDEMDLIDISRTFHPNAEYTFFSSAHGTFSRIDHTLGHKSNLSKFRKIEIVSIIFSDHNAMRLDINYKKKILRNTNTWRL